MITNFDPRFMLNFVFIASRDMIVTCMLILSNGWNRQQDHNVRSVMKIPLMALLSIFANFAHTILYDFCKGILFNV